MALVSPSILAADFSKLDSEIKSVSPYCDMLHLDIMDGHFVPNISFGPSLIRSIRSLTDIPFDTHLMVENPQDFIDTFIDAGSDIVTIHAESKHPLLKLVKMIKKRGKKAGIALSPKTDIDRIIQLMRDLDQITVMTVEPGFAGQKFMPEILDKIRMISNARDIHRAKKLRIEVDGGIDGTTGKSAAEAGADILAAGSFIFRAKDRKGAVNILKSF